MKVRPALEFQIVTCRSAVAAFGFHASLAALLLLCDWQACSTLGREIQTAPTDAKAQWLVNQIESVNLQMVPLLAVVYESSWQQFSLKRSFGSTGESDQKEVAGLP